MRDFESSLHGKWVYGWECCCRNANIRFATKCVVQGPMRPREYVKV